MNVPRRCEVPEGTTCSCTRWTLGDVVKTWYWSGLSTERSASLGSDSMAVWCFIIKEIKTEADSGPSVFTE